MWKRDIEPEEKPKPNQRNVAGNFRPPEEEKVHR